MIETKATHSNYIDKLNEPLTILRKEFHRHPELSGKELATAERIRAFLAKLKGVDKIFPVAKTGTCVLIKGKEEGPTVMIRADIDALPIEETNEFAHRSTTQDVSHKCGHDGHTVIALGLAAILSEQPPRSGTVVLLFQPAEENGKGAEAVLNDPEFSAMKIDRVFALHNLPGFPLHQIVCKSSTFTPNVQSIIINIQGKTSHAGEPELGCNPAPAIAEIIRFSEYMIKNDPERDDFTLITPVYITMGEKAYGISAGYGEVHLTLRTWNPEVMNRLSDELITFLNATALKFGLKIGHSWTEKFRSNENNNTAVEEVLEAAMAHGFSYHEKKHPFKWGEDFGLFTQRFNGAMFGIGAGEQTPALHNPDYDYPDDITSTGIKMFHCLISNILDK